MNDRSRRASSGARDRPCRELALLGLVALFVFAACKGNVAPALPGEVGMVDAGLALALPIGVGSFETAPGASDALSHALRARDSGQAEDALALATQALSLDPELAAAHRLRAALLVARHDTKDAIGEIAHALAEDLVGTEAALAADPKLAPLARETAVRALEEHDLAAYCEGTSDDLLFVGRSAPASSRPGRKETLLARHTELYAYRATTGRFRRLTNTDGHLLGWLRLPREAVVILVTASRAEGSALVDPAAFRLDLGTLDLAGPVKLPRAERLTVGFDGAGRPLALAASVTLALDFGALRSAAVAASPIGDRLEVWAGGALVSHPASGLAAPVAGVALDETSEVVAEGGMRAIGERIDSCPPGPIAPPASVPVTQDEGEIWIITGSRVADLATARGRADLGFQGNDLLVFGDGIGRGAALHLVDLASGRSRPLGPHAGAGLHAIVDAPLCGAATSQPTSLPAF